MATEPDGREAGGADGAVVRMSDGPGNVTGEVASHGSSDTAMTRVRRYPKGLYIALSVATLGWLLLATAAGIRQTDQPYPVTGYAMFSHPTDGVQVDFVLEGTTAPGRQTVLEPQDFGLTELQLRTFVINHIGPVPDELRPDADEHVAALAEVWSQRQGVDLDELAVLRVERSVDLDQPRERLLEQWSR